MTQINYQALREVAERAITAMERLLMLPADDDLLSEQELKDYGVDIDALNAFKILAGPETVLALLDELEAAKKRIAELESMAAPRLPQPAVPDVAKGVIDPCDLEYSDGYRAGWNACRSAMLHGADVSITHEGKNHHKDKLDMVDHSGDSNNMVEPVTDNTNQQFESLSIGDR